MTDRQRAEPDLLAELATLGSLALATGQARTSREVAATALEILARSTGADSGVVLFDAGSGFDIEASFGFPPGAVERMMADRTVSSTLAAALDASAEPIFAPSSSAPIRADIANALLAHGVVHLLAAPLRMAGNLVGVLALGWRTTPAAPPAAATILHATAVVGASLQNAHLVEQLSRALASERRLADEEVALQSLTLLAEKAVEFNELARTTVAQIASLLGAIGGSYALITDGDRVVHTASVGVDREWIEAAMGVPASTMLSVQRIVAGEGAYLQDYVEGSVLPGPLAMARSRGWTAYAMLPITVGDSVEAVIALYFEKPPDLPNADRTLTAIAGIASISLANFRLRDRLLASEARYRVLFEESPAAIVLLSGTNGIVDANPAALRLYRSDLDTLRTFAAAGGSGVSREERARRAEIVRRDGRGVFQDVGMRPDGSTFPEEVGIVTVHIGGESRHLLIVRDLTEQYHLQQELVQAQKMEAMGQLVSGVAHELNNPLAAIIAFSQLIRRDDRLPEDMQHDAELLVQEADRTRRIVQNLLDFARQRPPERHATSIETLVNSVIALQSYSITSGRIALEVDIPRDLPLIELDRSQLQQVLLNLTLNAIQAIGGKRGDGHIWIAARAVRGSAGRMIRLSVSDDGPGIAEADRSRLFMPFFTTKAPGDGTGLGLSVSFGIVAAHGGSLHFEPRSGGGASFIVELPVQGQVSDAAPEVGPTADEAHARPAGAAGIRPTRPNAAGEDTTEPNAARPTRADERGGPSVPASVLVLDDEPAIRALLTKSLRLAGLDAVTVEHGVDAIQRCRTESFAAVLIDHRMPGMSGTEVFNAVVAFRPEFASRFIFMSGDVLNPELRDFAATHGVALLAKPFDVDTVNRLVADTVARTLRNG